MARQKLLAMIMAGGSGSRLGALSAVRAKPAMPFAGTYRLIDFPLSNCHHSGIDDVWVVEQYQPHSLNDHLAGGRPWDLDRTVGGLKLLGPSQGGAAGGFHEGNADALYRYREQIRAFGPDELVVLSADHVYVLDYSEAIRYHREKGAGVTLVTTRAPIEEASRHGVVEADAEGRVTGFASKPEEPATEVVATEVFVYDPGTLLATLEALVGESGGREEAGLEDFGDALIPRLVEEGRAWAYPLEGYWKDVGTPDAYWEAHMDLLAAAPALRLHDPGWPILTYGGSHPPARIEATARIDAGLISPGCVVRGSVARSVLAPGVVVEEGATVVDAVILRDTTIERGATVRRAIVDRDVRVGRNATVGGDGELAVVGKGVEVVEGRSVSGETSIQPGTAPEDLTEVAG